MALKCYILIFRFDLLVSTQTVHSYCKNFWNDACNPNLHTSWVDARFFQLIPLPNALCTWSWVLSVSMNARSLHLACQPGLLSSMLNVEDAQVQLLIDSNSDRPWSWILLTCSSFEKKKESAMRRSCGIIPWKGLLGFFLLNMLWSRHVKPSPAKGEKSERSGIKDVKACTNWTFPESAWCTINDPLYNKGRIRTNYVMQRDQELRKKPTKSTHRGLSPSRTAGRAPQGNSNWHGRSRRRGGVAFAALVCSPQLHLSCVVFFCFG